MKMAFARGLDDLNAQRVDVRSFQTVTDGLAELQAAHRHNRDNDENDEKDEKDEKDELKAS